MRRRARAGPSSRKRRLPVPSTDGVDHEPVLVDEPVADQRLGESRRADDEDVFARLALQFAYLAGNVVDHGRHAPGALSHRRRGEVFERARPAAVREAAVGVLAGVPAACVTPSIDTYSKAISLRISPTRRTP